MSTVLHLTIASLKMLTRNKQALYFSLVLPVVIMLVFGFVVGDATIASRQMTYREFLVPGLVALTILQLGVFSVAFLISQYRDKGVLKKLLTTPLRPYEFLSAQILARLVIAVVQVFLLVAVAVLGLSFVVHGSYALLVIITILAALNFLTLGFIVAGLARSLETVPAVANMIVLPLLLLGDVFFPVGTFPDWLESVANLLPVQYVANAFRELMLNGASFTALRGDLLALLIWLAVLFAIAQRVFRFGARE